MDVVVDDQQLSQAIGRSGQNVRLATELTGWEINIMTDKDAVEKGAREAEEARDRLMEQLDIGDDVASILVQEGFTTLEEVAYVPEQELLEIEEFDEDLVTELRQRATDSLQVTALAAEEACKPQPDLLEMEGMDEETAIHIAKNGVRTMEELAECSVDELQEIIEIDEEYAKKLIMTARAPWFAEQA